MNLSTLFLYRLLYRLQVDRLYGWKTTPDLPIRDAFKLQKDHVNTEFEQRSSQVFLQLNEQVGGLFTLAGGRFSDQMGLFPARTRKWRMLQGGLCPPSWSLYPIPPPCQGFNAPLPPCQGLNVALYWKNPDPRSYVNVIPTSAVTGEGIPDLLQVSGRGGWVGAKCPHSLPRQGGTSTVRTSALSSSCNVWSKDIQIGTIRPVHPSYPC